MKFKLPDDSVDTAATLRELEENAPPPIRSVLIKAAQELEYAKKIAIEMVAVLDEAASLRIGQMDSQSRADEVLRQIHHALQHVAAQLRTIP